MEESESESSAAPRLHARSAAASARLARRCGARQRHGRVRGAPGTGEERERRRGRDGRRRRLGRRPHRRRRAAARVPRARATTTTPKKTRRSLSRPLPQPRQPRRRARSASASGKRKSPHRMMGPSCPAQRRGAPCATSSRARRRRSSSARTGPPSRCPSRRPAARSRACDAEVEARGGGGGRGPGRVTRARSGVWAGNRQGARALAGAAPRGPWPIRKAHGREAERATGRSGGPGLTRRPPRREAAVTMRALSHKYYC